MQTKTYTLQQAQQLVADGKAFIEFDIKDVGLLQNVTKQKFRGGYKFYDNFIGTYYKTNFKDMIHIALSQIQPEPIPNDVLKIVEKYGKDKILTYYELLKK